mgnify:CR=1 FL=1
MNNRGRGCNPKNVPLVAKMLQATFTISISQSFVHLYKWKIKGHTEIYKISRKYVIFNRQNMDSLCVSEKNVRGY